MMSVLTELPTTLRSGIRRYNVPGAAVAVHRRGRVTGAAAGVLNVDTRVPVTPDSVFQIGSISKIFTTTLIMQLADEGLVDLDAPVRTYLPDFKVADRSVAKSVTPRQFLCHTSGIEGDFFVDAGRGDDAIRRLQEMGTMLRNLFPPGERLSYCNFGFAMLGRITEVVTGLTWDQAMHRRIFDPLGMRHALTLPEETVKYRAAIGHVPHVRKPRENVISPMPWLSFGQKAAGATPTMSAADLLEFAAMHLNGGQSRSGERILSRSAVRQMQRPQIRLPKHFARGVEAWGLGWMLMRWSGERVIGHDGGTVGQYAFLRILPEQELAVALLTNGGDAPGLYDDIFATTFAKLGRVQMTAIPEVNERVKPDMAKLTGRYTNIASTTTVTTRGGRLFLARENTGIGGGEIKKAPLGFIDKQTARLQTGDPVLDRNVFIFQGLEDGPARFLLSGVRLSRRTPCAASLSEHS